jgi:hypothetical protein
MRDFYDLAPALALFRGFRFRQHPRESVELRTGNGTSTRLVRYITGAVVLPEYR